MILIVDDELENRKSLLEVLSREGWSCLEAESGESALEKLRQEPSIRLLITDLKMPGNMNGLELLQAARVLRPEVQRLLVTAFGTIEDTVSAMKAGAFDVLPKPIKIKNLKETVKRLLAVAPQGSVMAGTEAHYFSPSYTRVMDTLRRASGSEASVLFTGESGSGKSYLARVLHEWSKRREGPFVALNCAAIPEDLLESELFGFEKGAFTGATQAREGKIQAAHNGTLLLDEIGDLSLPLQAKLLQFIQDKTFYKLGSNKAFQANVRILSASNRNLTELVEEKLFREDLLYRLKVIEIFVPPLRERKEDLLWLLPMLIDSLSEKNSLPRVRFTQAALSKLWQYRWPGNIRELENMLESSLVLAAPESVQSGFLTEKDLPAHVFENGSGPELETGRFIDLASIEKKAIEQALLVTSGNKKLAAKLLGISERTLYRHL